MRSNCVLWALGQKWQYGGYIKINKTPRYFFVPRAKWSPDGITWYRFAPLVPVKHPTLLQNIFPLHVLFFEGHVIETNSGSSRRFC